MTNDLLWVCCGMSSLWHEYLSLWGVVDALPLCGYDKVAAM